MRKPPATKNSDVVTVFLPRETCSAQSQNPPPTDEVVSDNLAIYENVESPELQPSTEIEETIDPSDDRE